MGVAVTFDYSGWVTLFPEFTAVPEGAVTQQMTVVTSTVLRNDGSGPVSNAATQTTLLNYAIAHFVALAYQSAGDPQPGQPKSASAPVGRLSNATQGSVTAQFDMGTVTGKKAFWLQTRYGALFWEMTKSYRNFRYVLAPPYDPTPFLQGPRILG